MKKILTTILSISLVLAMMVSTSAISNNDTSTNTVLMSVQNVLVTMRSEKELYGLGSVNFDNLYLGNEIPTYETTNTGLQELNLKYYPIFEGSSLVAIAVIYMENNEYCAQISTQLVDDISDFWSANETGYLLFDAYNVYGISPESCELLEFGTVAISNRIDLSTTPATLSNSSNAEEMYATITPQTKITLPPQTRLTISNSINVPIKRQLNSDGTVNNSICWACCVASTGQYLTALNYTGSQIAIRYMGTDQNAYGDASAITSTLLMYYAQSYYFTSGNLPTSTLEASIDAHYPIIAGFRPANSNMGHEVTIRGYSITTNSSNQGTYSVMDPMSDNYASGTISSTGTCTYVYVSSGVTASMVDYAVSYEVDL